MVRFMPIIDITLNIKGSVNSPGSVNPSSRFIQYHQKCNESLMDRLSIKQLRLALHHGFEAHTTLQLRQRELLVHAPT
jgi:hypothetical protein